MAESDAPPPPDPAAADSESAWGGDATQYFFSLTPERILDAVEATGVRCTGRVLPLNSVENRVVEVELDVDDPDALSSPSERSRVAKFYRPGRWSRDQIMEEHEFVEDLYAADIPVIPALEFPEGGTVATMPDAPIHYCLYPKRGGRSWTELDDEGVRRLGRLLGRTHNVGDRTECDHRIAIAPDSYGTDHLRFLLEYDWIPENFRDRYRDLVMKICDLSWPWFEDVYYQRIHGDCHLGNVLWGPEGVFLLDFDDMLHGPCVQDLWLLIPGRDEEDRRQQQLLLEAYSEWRDFDRGELRLVEPLRALRFVHFSAWIARRWEDPAFPDLFPAFGSPEYWNEQVQDLAEQLDRCHAVARGGSKWGMVG